MENLRKDTIGKIAHIEQMFKMGLITNIQKFEMTFEVRQEFEIFKRLFSTTK